MDKKLYVLVRKDLTKAQQAVQAGHAVAEYLLRGPQNSWPNGTLVYLNVSNEEKLKRWCDNLKFLEIPFVTFKEPDLNDEVTALATITNDDGIFKSLRLAIN
jgi:hypothetical protein